MNEEVTTTVSHSAQRLVISRPTPSTVNTAAYASAATPNSAAVAVERLISYSWKDWCVTMDEQRAALGVLRTGPPPAHRRSAGGLAGGGGHGDTRRAADNHR